MFNKNTKKLDKSNDTEQMFNKINIKLNKSVKELLKRKGTCIS